MGEVTVESFRAPKGKIKKDAVIIHGMLSCGDAMKKFAHSLSYRKTHIPNITHISHKFIPKIKQKSFVEIFLGPEILRMVKKGKLAKPFDIIGHSNGGYAAIHLIDYLPKGYISNVMTIATPTAFYKLKPDFSKIKNIVHVEAGKDRVARRVTFGGGSRPTDSLFVFRFPDECHCSIHENSENNGLAEIISYMNGLKMNHSFVDENNVLHIWDWCHKEHIGKKYYKRSDADDFDFIICDGLHVDEPSNINKSEILKKNSGKLKPFDSLLRPYIIIRTQIEYIHKQNRLVKRLKIISKQLEIEKTRLKLRNKELTLEYAELQKEHIKLFNYEKQINKIIRARTLKILSALNMRKDIILDNLTAAEITSKFPVMSESDMQTLLDHMSIALDTYKNTNQILANGKYNLLKA